MKKYHLNEKGEAWPCNAVKGNCPFGGEANHFATPREARAFYEASQSSFPSTIEHDRLEAPYRDTVLPVYSEDAETLKAGLAEVFDQNAGVNNSWMADDTFTCDGGSVAAVLLARKLGLDAELKVGLYHHTDPEIRAAIIGVERDPDETDEEWYERVEEETDGMMEEHHHWAVLHTENGDRLIFDGNAAVREEEYVALASHVDDRYVDGAEYLVYDPNDDVYELATRLYPGLEAAVDSAVSKLELIK